MKKHILISILALLVFVIGSGQVLATGANQQYTGTLLPSKDSFWEIGTTTKEYLRGFFDNLYTGTLSVTDTGTTTIPPPSPIIEPRTPAAKPNSNNQRSNNTYTKEYSYGLIVTSTLMNLLIWQNSCLII